jgi:ABC-type antimicrobial peptide transport system permease subunit
LNELVSRDTGFERGHAILFDVRPGEIGYSGDRLKQFYLDLEDRLAVLPGVEAVGVAQNRPMSGGGFFDQVKVPGQANGINTAVQDGSTRFFAALGVPIVLGRAPTIEEVRADAKVAVISEDLVKDLNTPSPLGMRIALSDVQYTVIGVARQARYTGMHESNDVLYAPFDYTRLSATVVVRTSIAPAAELSAIRAAMKQLDSNLPMVDVYTMEQQISRSLQRERLFAWLCGSFGVLALVLCVVGLYGLMSHMTARRTPEMGIRMALGASRGDVLGQVLREGMKLAATGLLVGVPLAVCAAHLAKTQELLPEGPLPYAKLAVAIAILTASAILAVLGPAIRASAVAPMRALRRG